MAMAEVTNYTISSELREALSKLFGRPLKDRVRVTGRVQKAVYSPHVSPVEAHIHAAMIKENYGVEVPPMIIGTNPTTGEFEPVYLKGEPRRGYALGPNLVVDEGDALIADLLQNTPEKQKLDSSNGYIAVGTGGIAAQKSHTWVQTQTGSAEVMDTGYPQTKGDWGAANDNVIVYKSTFEAGDLNDTGIDEAVLANNTSDVGAETMAYDQMTSVDVGSSDTLAVTWEITLLGA